MEVMGLMLGEFVDDYTVRVIDVFAMPQSGTVSSIYRINVNFDVLDLLITDFYDLLGCKCRSCRPCLPGENVGYASANWST